MLWNSVSILVMCKGFQNKGRQRHPLWNVLLKHQFSSSCCKLFISKTLVNLFGHLPLICSTWQTPNELRHEKTCLRGFLPSLTQIGLYSHKRWLDAWNFGFRKWRDCTIYVAKTKVLISCAVNAQLVWVFVFTYAKSWFSHDVAQIKLLQS